MIYKLLATYSARGASVAPSTESWPRRPPGSLIWLHAPRAADNAIIGDLIARISDLDADMWMLVTGEPSTEIPTLPDQCFYLAIGPDTPAVATLFLDHWWPEIAIWVSGNLRPVLLSAAASRGIGLHLLDTGDAILAARRRAIYPGLTRTTLRTFTQIHAGDEATASALISAGAKHNAVVTTGVLDVAKPTLPCNQAERDTLAKLLASRPVWLAASISLFELSDVLAAHTHAMQRSHKLMLIVSPDQADAGRSFENVLRASGCEYAKRSIGQEPDNTTQVYLADTEDELGLWYRLAPVAFIGQTLHRENPRGPHPFDAATLGSVVVHGPSLGAHSEAYFRLSRAGASVQVENADDLARAIESLLSPEQAALRAHAAWQISSAGADVLEKIVSSLAAALGQKDAA